MKPITISMKSGTRTGTAFLFPLLAIIGFSPLAEAQLDIGLKMERKTYMAHEPVTGILTLINRAGRDVILDGKDGGSWLDFHVVDPRRQLISPLGNFDKPKPLVLKSGVPLEQRVIVSAMYPMGSTGMYAVKAQVYFSPLGRTFESNRSTINIVDGQKMWAQTVGVPPGLVGAGTFRTYALLTFMQGARKRSLFFRLADAETGIVRTTYSLGDYISVHKPDHLVDSKSRLHVLHLSGPQKYYYTVIDASGDAVLRETYRDHEGTQPALVVNSVTGDIKVQGGISIKEAMIPYEEREFRKLSERPPGMPLL
jgi:hypothetical protein